MIWCRMPNKIFWSKVRKRGSCQCCNNLHGTGIWCFYMNFLDIDLLSTGSHLISKLELLILETRVRLDIAIFRDDGHENEGLWVLHKDEFLITRWPLLNISATLWWVGSIDPKLKWTYDEPSVWMNHQYDYPTQTIMDMEWKKCHVQERLATKKKLFLLFPNFSR